MTWVRLDDAAPLDPKLLAVGPVAAWVWTCGLAYANRHVTAGIIPKHALSALYPSDTLPKTALNRAVSALVLAGLWADSGDCLVIRNYEKYQEEAMPEAVKERRDRAAERKRAERLRKRNNGLGQMSQCDGLRASADAPRSQSADVREGVSQAPDPSRPGPARDLASLDQRESETSGENLRFGSQVRTRFQKLYSETFKTLPSMTGKDVDQFSARVAATAEAQGRQPLDLLDEAFRAWARREHNAIEKRAPYAAFVQAWAELTAIRATTYVDAGF